jgi:ABC-2 type transport system ATP-binding protein
MNFARGLLNDPWIFFLDEPTLGLDVAAARSVRELVLAWKAAVPGRTILLTTHYMAEADELCERIAIVDHGRILALGTPDELKRRVQRESVFRIEVDRLDGGPATLRRLPGVLSAAAAAAQVEGQERQTIEVNLTLAEDSVLSTVVSALAERGSHLLALRKSEPSLEDVFVELVGRGFDEEVLEETDVERDSIDHDDSDDPRAPDRTPDPRDTAHEPGEREEEEAVV